MALPKLLIFRTNFLKQMNGRSYVLILFFWAVLTIVTPVLVRMSANAKQNMDYDGAMRQSLEASGGKSSLPRRALISAALHQTAAPASAPAPAPALEHDLGPDIKRLAIMIKNLVEKL